MTTTVRITLREWQWVKDRGAEFSSLLRRQIKRSMEEEEIRAATLYIHEQRRQAGLPIIGPSPPPLMDGHS